jgi:hypothetical protein
MPFCLGTPKLGVPKFPKLGLLQLWKHIILCANLWLKRDWKQSYNLLQDLSNNILHATCKKGNQGNSWFLMVKNQIANLTHGLSFGHNLCFKHPNGSCEPILDIYGPKDFQWYKEFFNPMSFDPCDCFLKNRKSNSQSGSSLGRVEVHSLTLSHTPGLHYWPTPLQALALVPSPRLGLQ